MKIRYLALLSAVLFLMGSMPNQPISDLVGQAHGLGSWWQTEVLQADLSVNFGNNPEFAATMIFETNGPRARMDIRYGPKIIYDGRTAYISPAEADFQMARFHVLTWPWFVAAPFKMRGHGSDLSSFKQVTVQGETYWNSRQTFDPDQGDSPEDWYEFFVDPETYLIRMMSYIVTYGRSLDAAEKNVSVIIYDDYVELNGIMLSQKWTFGLFSLKDGFQKKKGEGRLSNMRFISSDAELFKVPRDSRELPKPM